MDKRKFIHKLNKIISRFRLITDKVTVSYINEIIIIKFTRTNAIIKPKKYRKLWMIEKAFIIDEFIDLPQELIEYSLKEALYELYCI